MTKIDIKKTSTVISAKIYKKYNRFHGSVWFTRFRGMALQEGNKMCKNRKTPSANTPDIVLLQPLAELWSFFTIAGVCLDF
jgi:hypothetical protein